MPRRKPNWQFPCLSCKNCVKENQDSICCDSCNLWVHIKCTSLSQAQFYFLSNSDEPYYCVNCPPNNIPTQALVAQPIDPLPQPPNAPSPCSSTLPPTSCHTNLINNSLPSSSNPSSSNANQPHAHTVTPDITSLPPDLQSSNVVSTSSTPSIDSVSFTSSDYCESLHSSDFESDQDDLETRGIDFNALPIESRNKVPPAKFIKSAMNPQLSHRTRKYKFPCLVCGSPCIEGQNSICCFICDNWVHQKCTDLTLEQFNTYLLPDHADDPYFCTYCLHGNAPNDDVGNPDSTSHTVMSSILSRDNISEHCPNSAFNNREGTTLSDYYMIDEVNSLLIKKKRHTPPRNSAP